MKKKPDRKLKPGLEIIGALTPFVDDFNVLDDGSIIFKIGSFEPEPSPEREARLRAALKRMNDEKDPTTAA